MWDPQPPGAVQACQGIALHLPLRVCVTSTSSAVLTPGANTIGRSVEPRLGLECLEERKFLDISAHSGPGSVVGIAAGYGLDGPGIESRWGARFSAPVQSGLGVHPASCTMGTGSFPGVKSGRGVMLTPHPLLVLLVMKE